MERSVLFFIVSRVFERIAVAAGRGPASSLPHYISRFVLTCRAWSPSRLTFRFVWLAQPSPPRGSETWPGCRAVSVSPAESQVARKHGPPSSRQGSAGNTPGPGKQQRRAGPGQSPRAEQLVWWRAFTAAAAHFPREGLIASAGLALASRPSDAALTATKSRSSAARRDGREEEACEHCFPRGWRWSWR